MVRRFLYCSAATGRMSNQPDLNKGLYTTILVWRLSHSVQFVMESNCALFGSVGGIYEFNSNPSGYSPTGTMFVFVYYEKGKVLCRICIQERCHNKCLADGWAGWRAGPD